MTTVGALQYRPSTTTTQTQEVTMSNTFQPGDKVRIIGNDSANEAGKHSFDTGAEGTVVEFDPNYDAYVVKAPTGDRTYDQWVIAADLEPVVEAPARPTVTLTKSTSREYALRSNSRKIDEPLRRVLDAAAQGNTVDAVEFRKAVTQALSLAATRAGQSMARREYTKMARHLLYIADAVIDNHIDGLPAYAEGDRSRAVEDAKRALVEARQEVERLTEYGRAQSEEAFRANEARIGAENALAAAQGRSTVEHDNLVRTVKIAEFARSLLGDLDRAKVEGFIEGLDA